MAVLGDIFQHHLVEQHCDGVQIAGKRVRFHAQGFERDGAAAGKGIHHERPGARLAPQRFMGGLRQGSTGFQICFDRRVIPIGEVGDEIEQRGAQPMPMRRIGWIETLRMLAQSYPALHRLLRTTVC
jgi:hypothetical protein